MPENCGRGVQEKRDLGFLKETESGYGCESKAADHQRTPRNFQRETSPASNESSSVVGFVLFAI